MSSGSDGLTQEHLIMGKTNLIPHLTKIFNKSTEDGEFPEQWKDALVTPVLKKGNPELLENYRLVSCLPFASKLLEMVVYQQMSEYFEKKQSAPKQPAWFQAKKIHYVSLGGYNRL